MKQRRKESKPTLVWQVALIAFPILLLAALGLYALRKDRALAIDDARERAREDLRIFSASLSRRAADDFVRWTAFAYGWLEHHRDGFAGWPGSSHRTAWEHDPSPYDSHVQEWTRTFPGLPPSEGLPIQCTFSGKGSLLFPRDYDLPPQPPAWAFENPRPSPEANLNREWHAIRLQILDQPAERAVTNLLRFATAARQTSSESGLPLSTLVLLEVAKLCAQSGFTEAAWTQFSDEVFNRPSMLVPSLLDQLETACRSRSELLEEVKALRTVWEFNERQRETAYHVQHSMALVLTTATNLWIGSGPDRMLVMTAPSSSVSRTTRGDESLTFTNGIIQVEAFPKVMIERIFSLVHGDAASLPPYSRLAIELAGEPIGPVQMSTSNDVLAELEVLLPTPLSRKPSATGPIPGISSQAGTKLHLAILLTDRPLLLARQKQRQTLFGGLIATSLLAATFGLFRARQAFLKQQRLGELKDNFVSSVSHELRAPIASLRLMSESLAARRISDPARQSEYFRLMSQECRRLSSLVANVLDFSRIEQGRKEYQLESTNMEALVKDTIAVMQPNAEERRVTLTLRLEKSSADAADNGFESAVDGKAIQQALINLVDNAIKHAPSGSGISIGLTRCPDQPCGLELWVEDDGPGIPAAEHEKIFDRFYRLGSELRRETQGVGIGLSIVKHILEAHHGWVTVRSAPGEGSRFTLHLPTNGTTLKSPPNDRPPTDPGELPEKPG